MKYFLRIRGEHMEISETRAIEHLIEHVAYTADCGRLEALEQEIESLRKIFVLLIKISPNKKELIEQLMDMRYGHSDITIKEQ